MSLIEDTPLEEKLVNYQKRRLQLLSNAIKPIPAPPIKNTSAGARSRTCELLAECGILKRLDEAEDEA